MQQTTARQPIIWSSVRYAVCSRAGWRCQMCGMPEGARVLAPTGHWYAVSLVVDLHRRRKRAICQRCTIYETQEVVALPLTSGRKDPLRRLHVELVPMKPLLPATSAAWMR